jgi:hypothetical protein
MKSATYLFFFLLAAVAVSVLAAAGPQPAASPAQSQSTEQHLREPGWWPTKGDAARKDYAGSEACAGCHAEEVRTQQRTSMARAAWRAAETKVLRDNAKLSLNTPPFSTTISRDRKGSTYTVARGGEAIRGQVLWTMGNGAMGQTFVLQPAIPQAGTSLYEGQLSYFTATGALDLTPGHVAAAPRDLEQAFGEPQSPQTAKQCFGCHTTASSVRGQFDQAHATPGITCEGCHGPGAKHANAMAQGRLDEGKAAILNPASFDAVRQLDYCGACHRTPLDVAAAKDFVPINVRFQPYRLAKSRCWSKPDVRIACTACHNPHEEVVRESSFYDSKCLACHAAKVDSSLAASAPPAEASSETRKLSACPVSASRCTVCHMPKYAVPQMHGSFTDHDIRIVRAGAPYPL